MFSSFLFPFLMNKKRGAGATICGLPPRAWPNKDTPTRECWIESELLWLECHRPHPSTPKEPADEAQCMLETHPPHGTRHDLNEGPHACTQDLTPLGHPSWGKSLELWVVGYHEGWTFGVYSSRFVRTQILHWIACPRKDLDKFEGFLYGILNA